MPEKKKTNSKKTAGTKKVTGTSKTSTAKKSSAQSKTKTSSKTNSSTSNNVTKEFKMETKNAVKDVTNSIKNADIKKDTKGASNLVSSFLKNPIDTLRNLSDDSRNKHLIAAIIILAVWVAVLFITSMFGYRWTFATIGTRILTIITTIVSPIISLVGMSVILFIMQRFNKKSVTTIFTTITIATSPLVIISILNIITLFANDFARILLPISYIAQALTFVYMFFATKAILNVETDSKTIPKFMLSQLIYFVLYFVLTFLAISIPII